MTKLKTAANPYTVKGYKGVQQKHKHQRGVPETKIVISLPVNNLPPPIAEMKLDYEGIVMHDDEHNEDNIMF